MTSKLSKKLRKPKASTYRGDPAKEDAAQVIERNRELNAFLQAKPKQLINHKAALEVAIAKMKSPTQQDEPFWEQQAVLSQFNIEIPDVEDDLNRELAFYKQALEAVKVGRETLKALNIPFTRPNDYFAEMLKSDKHMERIKNKFIEEAQVAKAKEMARKQRELKKFGKQIQASKQLERHKQKRLNLEHIKLLRKRTKGESGEFEIELDQDIKKSDICKKRAPNRREKDAKYGFGGQKRGKRSNDKKSTFNFDPASVNSKKKMRPGKNRRKQNKF